jgi:hypothetical protein
LVYLDSSGIGELARIYVAVVKHGGAMKVIGLTPKVEEVLKITHLSQVFQEFPDEQSARQSVNAPDSQFDSCIFLLELDRAGSLFQTVSSAPILFRCPSFTPA